MLADHPLIPLYFYVNKHLVKPEVKGWYDNVMNVVYSQDLGTRRPTLSATGATCRSADAPTGARCSDTPNASGRRHSADNTAFAMIASPGKHRRPGDEERS